MIDEEIITSEPEEEYSPNPEPAPEPVSEPEPVFESEPTEPDPAPPPEPEPEVPAAPVEVITVDDLLDRLTGESQDGGEPGETENPAREEESGASEDGGAAGGGSMGEDGETVNTFAQMDKVLEYLEIVQQTENHPMLTTPFEDYTVTEGLLLLLLLSVFVSACVKLLKGGFAWLR